MNYFKSVFLLFLVFFTNICHSQDCFNTFSKNPETPWFIAAACGIQISGIKSEDFVSSNIAPALQANMGKWFTPEIALQIGYKGSFFRTISDADRHYYDYLYGEVLLNINELVNNRRRNNQWSLIIHPGAGYFYNHYYKRPNFCGNFGIMNALKLAGQIDLFLDISAIVGWDIYQGNEDILPGATIGIIYSF